MNNTCRQQQYMQVIKLLQSENIQLPMKGLVIQQGENTKGRSGKTCKGITRYRSTRYKRPGRERYSDTSAGAGS